MGAKKRASLVYSKKPNHKASPSSSPKTINQRWRLTSPIFSLILPGGGNGRKPRHGTRLMVVWNIDTVCVVLSSMNGLPNDGEAWPRSFACTEPPPCSNPAKCAVKRCMGSAIFRPPKRLPSRCSCSTEDIGASRIACMGAGMSRWEKMPVKLERARLQAC